MVFGSVVPPSSWFAHRASLRLVVDGSLHDCHELAQPGALLADSRHHQQRLRRQVDDDHLAVVPREHRLAAVRLVVGFGCIAVSEKEVPNLLVILV